MSIQQQVDHIIANNSSLVCVGLDSEFLKLPKHLQTAPNAQFAFNRAIIDATHDLVCAYKPNSAYYESQGAEGITQLKLTCDYLKATYPDIFVILDAKRGDGTHASNIGYARYAYDYLNVDGITLHSYTGSEALHPFLERADKAAIILCRTSNRGSGEMQDVLVNGEEYFKYVARKVDREWNTHGNCMLVVGATYPTELGELRAIVGDMTFLVPGVGAQGGDIERTVKAGINSQNAGLIINSSRGIIFAGDGADYADQARAATHQLREEINSYRGSQ